MKSSYRDKLDVQVLKHCTFSKTPIATAKEAQQYTSKMKKTI